MLYNDAYSAVVSTKHPGALGAPGKKVFPEVWQTIGPMLQRVTERGEAVQADDLLLMLERNGYPEECYFTFCYSPILDESGAVGGVFTPVHETTDRIIGERRLRTLSTLSALRAAKSANAEDACATIASTLAQNTIDIPCASIYLFDNTREYARRVTVIGDSIPDSLFPTSADVNTPWPSVAKILEGQFDFRELSGDDLGNSSRDKWGISVKQYIALPLTQPGEAKPRGFVIAGLNARKRMDENYLSFISLMADHVAAAISEAQAFEQERTRAEALAAIDRAKTIFFSNASHELRTPLTLMLGPIEYLLNSQLETKVHDDLQLVHRNGLRLLKLVNTLLDFARIEAGRANAVYQETDLSALTSDIASTFRSAIERSGLRFTIECNVREPVFVDRDMWEKIVLNLLSNAFKATLEGHIEVRLSSTHSHTELSVEDTGIGIPEHELPRMFERFHRIEGAKGRSHEGSGIGLAFVQELVRLHGGTIRVSSVWGEGSCFKVSIPNGKEHLPPECVDTGTRWNATGALSNSYVDEAIQWLPEAQRPSGDAVIFASDLVTAPHQAQGEGYILIVDDNADMRAYAHRLLGDRFEVQLAKNGVEALSAIQKRVPDLILTDVMMPQLDGFQLLRELRSSETTRTIPVILLSAKAGEEARIEGLEAGADDYIVKPFTSRELLARVGGTISMSRLRKEVAAREAALRSEAAEALRRSEKLAAAGKLAATVAHELNNPLEIAVNVIYLAKQIATNPEQRNYLETAEKELNRAARLANRTLSFHRGGQSRGKIDIGNLVQETTKIFEGNCLSKSIRMDALLTPELTVYGSSDELLQVFINVLSNAIEAVRQNGRIMVRCKRYRSFDSRQYFAMVTVADNGTGIVKENKTRIFEPFFTTKQDSGTGLGLWISKEIIEKHDGKIRVHTKTKGKLKGTIISIMIPLTE